jgi:hypothetical protein|tara:strand:- start:153 stop:389 length:237 start_codon:yes stop_codon:yes gene_type:complete
MNREELRKIKDKKERMDTLEKIIVIRKAMRETRDSLTIPYYVEGKWSITDKRDVVLSAWKNYCRESFIYRVLEFFKLR